MLVGKVPLRGPEFAVDLSSKVGHLEVEVVLVARRWHDHLFSRGESNNPKVKMTWRRI